MASIVPDDDLLLQFDKVVDFERLPTAFDILQRADRNTVKLQLKSFVSLAGSFPN